MKKSGTSDHPPMSIRLLEDQHGRPVHQVVKSDKVAYVRRSEVAATGNSVGALARVLASQGVDVLSTAQLRHIINQMDQDQEVSGNVVLATYCGWATRETFVFGDGVAYTNGEIDSAVAVLFKRRLKSSTRGSPEAWRAGMARLSGQWLLQAVVCVGLVPIILRHYGRLANVSENFALQLTGKTSTGKTTALRVAGSLWGGREDSDTGWAETWWSTDNGVEKLMHQHTDALLVLDEASLAGSGRRARIDKQRAAVFMLASGRGRARHDDDDDVQIARLVTLSSSNEPLSSHDPQQGRVDAAVGVRMPSVDLTVRPHGVLDRLGATGAAAVIEALNAVIRDNYGHGAREFVRHLTGEIARDEAKLGRRIKGYIKLFREKAGYADLSGEAQRVCNAFALIHAAGQLGLQYGALPAEWDRLGDAVLSTYNFALYGEAPSGKAEIEQFETRLNALMGEKKIVPLPLDAAHAMLSDREAVGYIKSAPKGRAELLIRPSMFKDHLMTSATILNTLRRMKLLTVDGAHLTTWRKLIPPQEPERFHVIRVDAGAARFGEIKVSCPALDDIAAARSKPTPKCLSEVQASPPPTAGRRPAARRPPPKVW